MIAILEEFHSHAISINTSMETVCACVQFNYKDTIVCACYRPPNSPLTYCDNLNDALHCIPAHFPQSPIFVLGDFNSSDICRGDGNTKPLARSSESLIFFNSCKDFNFTQTVTQHMRAIPSPSNLLDLVLTTNPSTILSITHLSGLSDHFILNLLYNVKPCRHARCTNLMKDYKNVDFQSVNVGCDFMKQCSS